MNYATRKEIVKIIATVEGLRDEIQGLANAEREKFNNMSEGLQESERGQAIGSAADALESAGDTCDELVSFLNDAIV